MNLYFHLTLEAKNIAYLFLLLWVPRPGHARCACLPGLHKSLQQAHAPRLYWSDSAALPSDSILAQSGALARGGRCPHLALLPKIFPCLCAKYKCVN